METTPQGISLFGTDLDVGIKVELEAGVLEPGAAVAPAKKLYEITRELPEAQIDLEVDQDLIMTLRCERSEFRLKCLPKEEFPTIPEFKKGEGYSIKRETLHEMIHKTIYAVSTDQTRHTLTGAFFQLLPEEIRLVATDGHRLAIIRRGRGEIRGSGNREAIIPKKALSEVLKILRDEEGEVGLVFANNQLIFDLQKNILIARLIEGQFPNYEQVIPGVAPKRAIIKKALLGGALKRTSAILGERPVPTKLEISRGRMVVSCTSLDLGEAKETVDVDYQGEDFSVGFNAKYILDFLNVTSGEEVVIHFSDPLSPTLYRILGDEEYGCVIMPMRL